MLRGITVAASLLLWIGLTVADAQHDNASTSIIRRSPFIPADFNPSDQGIPATATQQPATGYEFRGVYQIGSRYWFLVSEPNSKDGTWIELGQPVDNIEARHYDPEAGSLTVFSNNMEYTLELVEMDANPVPIPVQGLVKASPRTPVVAPIPVRRTISPTATGRAVTVPAPENRAGPSGPAPAWLEKLRAEAAERRARATQGQQDGDDGSGAADPRRRVITPNRPAQPQQQPQGEEQPSSGTRFRPAR